MRSALVLLALLFASEAAAQGEPARGEAFMRSHCSGCHAIGPTGASTNPRAPAFRDLHRRYPVEQLAEALAEGITTGHRDMPAFELTTEQIDDVIAYLRALERR